MALFKISRGTAKNLPAVLTEGYCWYTYDNSKFYIDFKDENGVLTRKALNAQEAEKLTGYDIATILNSSDIEIPTSKAVFTAISNKADKTHTHDDRYYTETEVDTKLDTKVDKVTGKGLSTNDYTTNEKNKLAGIATGATKVADSTTNGNILINGTETTVYAHPNSGVTAGTYKSVTVNAQGHITAGTNPTTLAGYGITDAESKGAASSALTSAKTYTDTELAKKANTSDLTSHTGNTTAHITATERTNWNTAYSHSQTAHAPSNAEKNQNAFSNIAVSGQNTVAADTATDTVTFAGTNVTITTDATNDKVTFAVADGTTSAKGVVQLTNSTSSTSTTTAATPNSVKAAYDLANTANTTASTVQTNLANEITRAKQAEEQILTTSMADWFVGDASNAAYIKNKPIHTSSVNITWDGSTSNKLTVATSAGDTYCRVTETLLASYDFTDNNATLKLLDTYFNSEFVEDVTFDDVFDYNGILVVGDYYVVSTPRDDMSLTIGAETVNFRYAGTYFRSVPGAYYISGLTISGTDKRILAKNLPLGIASKAEIEHHKANSTWEKIYDSGAINKKVNAFMDINVTGYKKLKVAIKCVNTTDSTGTTAGEISFKAISDINYYFSNLFPNLITKSTNISAAMVEFTIVDGFIFCDNVLRSTTSTDIFSNYDGQGTWNMTNLGGGIMTCYDPLVTMNVSTLNSSTQYYYGVNSRVIVWGCKE